MDLMAGALPGFRGCVETAPYLSRAVKPCRENKESRVTIAQSSWREKGNKESEPSENSATLYLLYIRVGTRGTSFSLEMAKRLLTLMPFVSGSRSSDQPSHKALLAFSGIY